MEIMTENWEILFQLFLAILLAGLLGLERALARKTAGLRTFALVGMGSALFVIISKIVSEEYIGLVDFDPLRMASQIIVGIGFIGAGLIILRKAKISGLTTAAGLWVAAGIGMAVGYKLYWLAVFATLLTLFIFTALWFIEKKFKKVAEEAVEDIEET